MSIEIFDDFEQGSPRWHEVRVGIPTASVFQKIIANSAKRTERETLLYKLAGERITGEPAENYSNAAMDAGKRDEPELRERYEALQICTIRQVAFVRNGKCGCSPDALVDDEGVLEIKRASPQVLIPLLRANKFPSQHLAPCQGALMVTERQWCDLFIGHPKMGRYFRARVQRDEMYIAELRKEIDLFDLELRRLVEEMR